MDDDDADEGATRNERVPRWRLATAEHQGEKAARVVAPVTTPSIAQYEIGQELGRGGMGVVFAATDTALSRPVAIKQALTHRAEDLHRFEREVRITAHLEHPSIVPIYEAGRDEAGHPYYVMRQIEGDRLSDRVARAKTFAERLALVSTVLAAIDAAAYAHARGIIHRDIKPHNILLGAHGETFLIDWGIARELERQDVESTSERAAKPTGELTSAGQVFGTVGFMAPEQARGEPVDRRADVYALGVTLAFVLSGTLTIGLDDTAVVELDRRLPAALTAIVEKASATKPEARYRDAGELAADLRAFLAGQLVGAYRYTRRERLWHFGRRHRIAITVATAALVTAVAVGALALQNLVHERDLANRGRVEAEAQQRIANDRAEVALLDRASVLAARDPTRAAALLRQLPATSPHLARARDIAANAAVAGIAHGLHPHEGRVTTMAWSRDGKQLASGSQDGTIQLHDLVTRRSRIVFRGEYVNNLVWGSTSAFAFTSGPTLHVFDTATGVERAIDPQIKIEDIWPTESGERLRYFDKARRLVAEIALAGGPEVLLARDADAAVGEGDVFIVRRRDRFELVAGADVHPLPSLGWDQLTISFDHRRVAGIVDGSEVAEWEIATGHLQRWPIAHPKTAFYSPYGLYAAQPSALLRLHAAGMETLAGGTWDLVWTAPVRNEELALVSNSGTLWVLDKVGRHEIGSPTTNVSGIAGREGLAMVAVGTTDGAIYWWDLRGVLSDSEYQVDVRSKLCGLDETRIVLYGSDGLTVIDRATGARRSTEIPLELQCEHVTKGFAVLRDMNGQRQLFALDTGRLDHRFGPRIAYDGDGHVIDVDSTVLRELGAQHAGEGGGGGDEIERWRAPGQIIAAGVKDRWIAAQADDGTVVRIDRTTNERVTYKNQPLADHFDVSADGVVWIMSGGILLRLDAGRVMSLGRTKSSVRTLHAYRDRAIVLHADGSLVAHAPAGTVVLAGSDHREVLFEGRIALSKVRGSIATYFLDTDEASIRNLPENVTSATVSRSGEIAVQLSRRLVVFRDRGPPTPADLHAWLDDATNATIDDGTLIWQ